MTAAEAMHKRIQAKTPMQHHWQSHQQGQVKAAMDNLVSKMGDIVAMLSSRVYIHQK